MSLFSSIANAGLSIQTSYGGVSFKDGKPVVTVGGAAPQLPEPTPLTPAGTTMNGGPLAWLKRNPLAIVAGIAAVVVIILAARR